MRRVPRTPPRLRRGRDEPARLGDLLAVVLARAGLPPPPPPKVVNVRKPFHGGTDNRSMVEQEPEGTQIILPRSRL